MASCLPLLPTIADPAQAELKRALLHKGKEYFATAFGEAYRPQRSSTNWAARDLEAPVKVESAPTLPPPAATKAAAEGKVHCVGTVWAWFMLLSGITAWSYTGPLYVYLPNDLKVRPFRVALWRYAVGFIPFFLSFVATVARNGLRDDHLQKLLSPKSWPLFSLLAITTLGGFSLFGLATVHCRQFAFAVGLTALNPFLLLLWELSQGRSIGKWNGRGLGLAAVGVAGMLLADHGRSPRGTAEGLGASLFFTVYVAAAEALSAKLPFAALMSITFGMGAVLAAALTFLLEGTTVAPGAESVWGVVRDQETLVSVGALTGAYIWGLMGLTASAKDLPALVLAVAIALEPMVSVGIVAAAERRLPGHLLAASMVFVVVGSITVGCAAAVKGTETATPPPAAAKAQCALPNPIGENVVLPNSEDRVL